MTKIITYLQKRTFFDFQAVLTDFQLKVWELKCSPHLIFQGEPKEKKIYLLFYKNHCQPIRSITQFFNRVYFCDYCNTGYSNKENHACAFTCKYCFKTGGNCLLIGWLQCSDCSRRFPSQECFNSHKEGSKSICEKVKICPGCKRQLQVNRTHRCGLDQCTICKQ